MRQVFFAQFVHLHVGSALSGGMPALPEDKGAAEHGVHRLVRPGVAVEHVRGELFVRLQIHYQPAPRLRLQRRAARLVEAAWQGQMDSWGKQPLDAGILRARRPEIFATVPLVARHTTPTTTTTRRARVDPWHHHGKSTQPTATHQSLSLHRIGHPNPICIVLIHPTTGTAAVAAAVTHAHTCTGSPTTDPPQHVVVVIILIVIIVITSSNMPSIPREKPLHVSLHLAHHRPRRRIRLRPPLCCPRLCPSHHHVLKQPRPRMILSAECSSSSWR
mmetsp:Transcript_702/g.1213  ORF Transcript_702/g.1213 Transcript_702/m.1213 type:complete len:274 (+) Transcript_702:3457-4278(+)